MIGLLVVAGAAVGLGVWFAARAAAPPVPDLGRRLLRLHSPPEADPASGVRHRWQAWVLRTMSAVGVDAVEVRRDLEVAGVSPEQQATAKRAMALTGACLPLLVVGVWAAGGIPVAPGLTVTMVAVGAAAGFVLPDVLLARTAARRRREFRQALGLYLDLVVIVLAGAGGPHTAIHQAADRGQGWALGQLRDALELARNQQQSPWVAIRELGERLGISALTELAATVQLAGDEGARVRESLHAKAVSLRQHDLAETEAELTSASERLGGPVVVMFIALLLFIGYPALAVVVAL
ncbi:MAG: secretion system protein [Acidimicrobiales bacterium]